MNFNRQADDARARRDSAKALLAAGLGVLLGCSSTALANPADLFGFGARQIGMGNAFTAVADDPFAAYFNPGGLIQTDRITVALGMQGGHMMLGDYSLCPENEGVGCSQPFYLMEGGVETVQQKRYAYEEPIGTHVALAIPVFPKVHFGTVAYLPSNIVYDDEGNFAGVKARLTRFMSMDPYLPEYVLYQNRPQRFSAYFALSFEPLEGLGIGVGASVLASSELTVDVRGTVNASTTEAEDGTTTANIVTEMTPMMTMELAPAMTPIAGILWNLGTLSPSLQGWQVGVTYRGSASLGADAGVSADLTLALDLGEDETPLSYGMKTEPMTMSMLDFFTPQQAAFGMSGLFADRFRASADVTWTDWSAFKVSTSTMPSDVPSALGTTVTIKDAREIDSSMFQDTFTPRVGIEARMGPFLTDTWLRGVDTFVRMGGGFEQNPFGTQTGKTNLLNSDRVLGGIGLGFKGRNPFDKEVDKPVSVDLALQYHYLFPTQHTKATSAGETPTDGYPINGTYVSQGSVLQGALTVILGF